jgi:hypothetical protein
VGTLLLVEIQVRGQIGSEVLESVFECHFVELNFCGLELGAVFLHLSETVELDASKFLPEHVIANGRSFVLVLQRFFEFIPGGDGKRMC